MQKTVAVNEFGLRVGEDHPNAKLTDREIELIRDMHEVNGMSYLELAKRFEVSKGSIAKICRYERRGAYATREKKV